MPPKSKRAKLDAASAQTGSSTATSKAVPAPNWPELAPVVPAADLSLNVLLTDQILTIPRLWTSTLCKTYVNLLASLPLVTTPGKPRRGEAVRVNDRFQVEDPAFAGGLWGNTALKDIVENPVIDGKSLDETAKRKLWGGEVLGLNSNIRVYRYSKGQFFDQHCKPSVFLLPAITKCHLDDDSNNIMFPSASSTCAIPAKTTWTLLLYLTSPTTGCEGGETVFYPDPPSRKTAAPPPVITNLEVGMALLHRHGKDCLLHEGREVTAGEKWVIRSDLCVKR